MNITSNTYTDVGGLAIDKQKSQFKNLQNKNSENLKEVAEDFEAFFLSRTMQSMFDTVKTDAMFGGGNAENVFKSLLINEYGRAMAKNGGIGVADYVMNTLIELQENQSNGNSGV